MNKMLEELAIDYHGCYTHYDQRKGLHKHLTETKHWNLKPNDTWNIVDILRRFTSEKARNARRAKSTENICNEHRVFMSMMRTTFPENEYLYEMIFKILKDIRRHRNGQIEY